MDSVNSSSHQQRAERASTGGEEDSLPVPGSRVERSADRGPLMVTPSGGSLHVYGGGSPNRRKAIRHGETETGRRLNDWLSSSGRHGSARLGAAARPPD